MTFTERGEHYVSRYISVRRALRTSSFTAGRAGFLWEMYHPVLRFDCKYIEESVNLSIAVLQRIAFGENDLLQGRLAVMFQTAVYWVGVEVSEFSVTTYDFLFGYRPGHGSMYQMSEL